MPNINKKSNENLSAAQKLIDNNMFSSSVHCSYYSCLLKMKYIISQHTDTKNGKHPLDYSAQEARFRCKDSHKEILQEICNRITNTTTARDIKNYFAKLKNDRVSADYKEKIFTDIECLDDINLAKSILSRLTSTFKC